MATENRLFLSSVQQLFMYLKTSSLHILHQLTLSDSISFSLWGRLFSRPCFPLCTFQLLCVSLEGPCLGRAAVIPAEVLSAWVNYEISVVICQAVLQHVYPTIVFAMA